MVDSVTPMGFSGSSDAPPGKDAGGTEINLSPCKVTISTVNIFFFNNIKRCIPSNRNTPFHYNYKD
ncbi:hypothetical protein C7B89_08690 [Lysinibacillus capsici]|nr:hypothetical protein C7B89_08690 [Lysinibacillus capsici]